MKKKVLIAASIIILIILSIAFINFRGQINCILIGWSNYNQIEKNIYVEASLANEKSEVIIENTIKAKERVAELFGDFTADPVIIICKDIDSGKKFGMKNNTGITHKTMIGTFIVLGKEGLNTDVIAHELAHSELAYRVGWVKGLKIPIWFDDGLATQVDNRPQYSEDEWIRRTENGKKAIKMSELDSVNQFYVSDLDTRRFHYTLAKHELKRWISIVHQKGLLELIELVKKGKDLYFEYNRIEASASK